MKTVKIDEVNNAYHVWVDGKPYAYRSIDVLMMLEEIGKHLLGRKVVVREK